LDVPPSDWIATNRLAFAIWDNFPVNPGHALVVPRRLISSWWEATDEERHDLIALIDEVRNQIEHRFAPDGFNIGFNAGAAAGQTVPHLHLHVIPRYDGDVNDPRGGIRHVVPDRANYLLDAPTLEAAPFHESFDLFDGRERRLDQELIRNLRDPAFERIDLVVSFIMRSGLELIVGALRDALERDAQVRILTTDYLQITEHAALRQLLDLAEDFPNLQVRVFRDPGLSFHPKAYLFWSPRADAVRVIVGSSNLSRSGLADGVEWNVAFARPGETLERFAKLWEDARAVELTADWLRTYAPSRRQPQPAVVELGEPPVQPVVPRLLQQEALAALARTRADGHRAGLVVMATGLGKTWLAAFDSARPQFGRVLFVAHREEILRQSRDVFRRVLPDGDLGLYHGSEKQPDARVVFASVQTLAGRLSQFPRGAFSYVVIDEFHHAAASSYRKVIDHFSPDFLLGLTATPDRMDGADLLALCGDNLVYECTLLEGIERGELVPLHYWGVPDPVDFEPIPWRAGRFDLDALTGAVETRERAQSALEEWSKRHGGRTLGFCVSISHADFMARYFTERGIACAAVHTGPASAPRHETVEALREGRLEIVFAVDIFNEGLDVPEIDTVLMLRPTESPVVFLQQLGRGLRTNEGKANLDVVDFIGNHRSFLLKPRTLLGLSSGTTPSTARVVRALKNGDFGLPSGCSVSYELEVVDMLRRLARVSAKSGLEDYCRSYFEEEGTRPSAVQTFLAGYNPASARAAHDGWFGFIADLGIASEGERAVALSVGDVLDGFESEPITKSYKLIVLRALLQDAALRTGASVGQLAATSRDIVLSDPRLVRDVGDREFPDIAEAPLDAWKRYWRRWPIAHWTEPGKRRQWFRLDGERMVPTFRVPDELGDTFDQMASEIVEYRLARYLLKKQSPSGRDMWTLRVSQANGRPLIWLNRPANPGLPEGEARFTADGREYVGRFVKIALNVADIPGEPGNALHALLRRWFGPGAGLPGTHHEVVLQRIGGRYTLRPRIGSGMGDARVA
jgi:superfamily II DNA or RNA helicase/diadenosine tetraphosphate (Ap4A) HIT family hydrolase